MAVLSLSLSALGLLAIGATPFRLEAVHAATPPVIDGRVGELEWNGAARAGAFVEFEPHRGEPMDVRTEALVLYDETHLYVAFRAFDSEPPTARLTQRDADLLTDDAVVVIVDSELNQQSAAYFMTSALGTQADGRVTEDGGRVDGAWDTAWRSASRVHAQGWSAELAIPLAAIHYVPGQRRNWGLNLGRSRPRSRELGYWAGPLTKRLQVSGGGLLVGLDLEPPRHRHEVVPYGLSQLQEGRRAGWNGGIDARYAITPQITAFATLNPDFATIEADRETVNLSRFELSLPEKRQFFVEGNELFSQRIRTFYSRRVADIQVGTKLLGRTGPWSLEILSAQSDVDSSPPRANYTVGRAQRDFGRSYVGAMIANRRLDGLDQGAASVDASLLLSETAGVTAQVARSHGRYGQGTWGYLVRPTYDSPTTHFHIRLNDLGEHLADNVNVIGFVNDDDRREVDTNYSRTFWPRGGPAERFRNQLLYNIYWGHDGRVRGWEIRPRLEVDLRNRWSAAATYAEQFRSFEKGFRNDELSLDLGYNTREYQSVSVGYAFGRNFDADFQLWTAGGKYKVTLRLSAEYDLQRFEVDPDPTHRSTWIHVVRVSQFFTKDLFLKAFFQTNSSIDRRNVQAVFVYRYHPPFGTVQVAYQRGTAAFGLPSDQGNTLFVKLTGVF